jgi:hypothetical protein
MSAALIAPPRTPRAGTLGQPRILLDPQERHRTDLPKFEMPCMSEADIPRITEPSPWLYLAAAVTSQSTFCDP